MYVIWRCSEMFLHFCPVSFVSYCKCGVRRSSVISKGLFISKRILPSTSTVRSRDILQRPKEIAGVLWETDFIATFAKAQYRSVSWTRQIEPGLLHPMSFNPFNIVVLPTPRFLLSFFGFSHWMKCALIISPTRATVLTHPILFDLITLITFGDVTNY